MPELSIGTARRGATGGGSKPSPAEWLVVAGLVLVHLALATSSARRLGITFDEPVHLVAGLAYWTTGDYRLNGDDHPALAPLVGALPLVLLGVRIDTEHPIWIQANWTFSPNAYAYADHVLHRGPRPAGELLVAGRLAMLVFPLLLLPVVWWAARQRFGPLPGLVALALAALSPSILGHSALVTTDVAQTAFFFAFFVALDAAFRHRTVGRELVAGLLLGLALATKYPAVAMLPAAGLVALLEIRARRLTIAAASRGATIVLVTAALVVSVVYRGHQLPVYLDGFSVLFEAVGSRPAFLCGRHTTSGWPWYFPAAALFKSTVPELVAGALVAIAALRRRLPLTPALVVPPLVFLALAFGSSVNIGYRHVMPALPFLFVAAAATVPQRPSRVVGGLLLVLAGWQGWAVAVSHPAHLAYFNELVGGQDRGHRLLVDSNVDWGQALPDLARHVREHRLGPIYLAYFGSGSPADEGLRAIHVLSRGGSPRPDTATEDEMLLAPRIVLAVSVTLFHGVYTERHDDFAFLRHRAPIALVGHSILVYDLTDDRDGRAGLAGLLVRQGHLRLAAAVDPTGLSSVP